MRHAVDRMRRREESRRAQIGPLDRVMAEMLIEPRPPGRAQRVARLQHAAQARAGAAAHQAEMAAVPARHQFDNDARLAVALGAEHDGFIGPLHGLPSFRGARSASPESINTNLPGLTQSNIRSDGGYGFRAPRGACHRAALRADPLARPRNDDHSFGNSNPISL